MNYGIISIRYARALFSFAQDKSVLDLVFEEMKQLSEALVNNKKIRDLIDNPVIKKEDKISIIKDIFNSKVSTVLDKFIHLVVNHRREEFLLRISLVFIDLYRESKNIRVGKLITASPVNDEMCDKIKSLLKTKHSGEIEFETSVDPSIDGGFILYIDTYRLDASVTTQLKNIKRQLLNKNNRRSA